LKLKECNVDVMPGEDGLDFLRTTADLSAPPSFTLGESVRDNLNVLTLGCVGPSNEAGDAETVVVRVGQDVVLDTLEVSFEGIGGMIRVNNIEVTNRFDARGAMGVVQLYSDKTPEIEIQLDGGYVGFVNSEFHNATMVFGEEVDFYSWQDPDNTGMEVKLETVENANTSSGLCVSDGTTSPFLQEVAEDDHDVYFKLGKAPYRQMQITRNSGNNRMVFSHGVYISDRHCNNTFDTFPSVFQAKPDLGFGFKEFTQQEYDTGMELLNLWLVGSTLGLDTQSMDSKGMWIFTTTGSGLVWFPMHIWRIFTLSIMEPRASREVGIVQDQTCLSKYAKLVQGKPSCRPDITSEAAVISNLLRVQAMAIRNSLPTDLNLTNAPNSRIYYVKDVPVQTNFWPSLADGNVTVLATRTGSLVKWKAQARPYFHGLVGALFITALCILPFLGGTFACILIGMLYKMEKRRYLRARGTDKPSQSQAWNSTTPKASNSPSRGRSKPSIYSQRFSPEVADMIQEFLEDEAKSNLLLTLVRCQILRSPAGGKELSVKQVVQMVLGHFVVMQLLVSPFVLVGILLLDNLPAARALCGHNAWMHGHCINTQTDGVSWILIVLGIVFEGVFYLNAVLEYTTRYALDMMESTGSAPRCYLRLMRIRASKVYAKTISVIQSFTLFIFCSYFIMVILFILLGTLLHPETLGPVLLSIGGAAVVGQQITVKFNEIVEKAKKFLAEALQKVDTFIKDTEDTIKGVAGDVLDKIPGGDKASAMLANALPSADQLKEKLNEQALNAMDSLKSPEDLHRILIESPQAVARSLETFGVGAGQMLKGVAANNVGDVVQMLEAMASKNSSASTQMLKAALMNHKESGMKIMKELITRNPSAAASILKGVGEETVSDVLEELPAEQAEPFQRALKDAGFSIVPDTDAVGKVEAAVPGAIPQVEGTMSNTKDIAQNLQELAAMNPDAASQLLQAVSGGQQSDGAKIMQEMAAINPSSAAQLLKGVAAGDLQGAIEMLEALSGTEQAKYLESALADAGFPISMAELASFKKMAEEAQKFAANPLQVLQSGQAQAAQATGMQDLGGALGAKTATDMTKDLNETDLQTSEEKAEDFEENLLMMLGLSKSQLVLLNIQAVILFLSWVGFMLMGAYIFLGSEALIPQLTANVSAVGSAVTMIRSRSSELQSGDLKSIQSTMQAASSELKGNAPSLEKKTQ